MKNKLKKYDKFIYLCRSIDGKIIIKRTSPFNKSKEFEILRIENQFIGSGKFILTKLQKMDNQRHNIVGEVQDINNKLYRREDNNNVHKELANFLTKSII